MIPTRLNILIAEDSTDDVELIEAELRRAGFDPTWRRVDTEADFCAELQKKPDLVMADYSMPQFDGLRAAQITLESGLDIPFILISGTVGEEVAVEAMKRGAADYFLKDRLARLGQSVSQALVQKQLRAERRRAEEANRNQLQELRRWQEAMLDREERIMELKHEVNELLAELKQPHRYANLTDG
jgi:DNA-binding NtrC family response regulator